MRPKMPTNRRKVNRVKNLRRATQTDNPRKNLRRFNKLSEKGKTGLSIGMNRAYGKVLENRLKNAEEKKAGKLRLKAKSQVKNRNKPAKGSGQRVRRGLTKGRGILSALSRRK